MQINLKQADIVKALEAYVANQGISLSGKTVDITFSAGRKENGLSASIVIEDGFVAEADEQAVEVQVTPRPPGLVLNLVKAEVEPIQDPIQDEPMPVIDPPTEDPAPAAPAGKSLFGN